MTTTAPSRPYSVDAVRAIADPRERLEAAAHLLRTATDRSEGARAMRDMAVIVAHLDNGVPPVAIYRDVLDVSRGLFVRIIQRAPAKREPMDNPLAQARESADAVRRHDEVVEQARDLRDSTAVLLMDGGIDPTTGEQVSPISNADVARLVGLSTARIAQVRTGTR